MLTLAVEAWIGNAAAVVSGAWGGVTQRAKQSGYSRTSIYSHAHRVVRTVLNEQTSGVSYAVLLADHKRLRSENEALWQAWAEAEELSEAKQREFASAGSAMGLSLTQIVTLLAIVLPRLAVPSRSKAGRWVQQASKQASHILHVLDRACQKWVLTLCLDEIFFHHEPILMAVEPTSMAWVAAQRGPDRTGESWEKVVAEWPHLEYVIADGGKGIERGVKLADEARPGQTPEPGADVSPPLTRGLDVFHTQREVERVLHRQWKQVARQMEAASEMDAKVLQSKRRGHDLRGIAGPAGRAWRKAERLFDDAVQADGAAGRITAALSWFRPDGTLQTREEAQPQLREASKQLPGPQWSRVRRLLSDERTLRHLDRIHEQLAAVVSVPLFRESLTRLWYFSDVMRQAQGEDCHRFTHLMAMEQVLCQRLCAQWMWNAAETRLGMWVRGQLILMATIGIGTSVAYTLLGVPAALLLGLIAAVAEAIPIVGPLLGAIPAVLVAATVSPQLALAVAGVYLVLQLIEGNVLVPIVMRNTIGISPFLVILSVLIGGAAGGFVGALFAVPIAAVGEVLIEGLQARETPVAQDPSGSDTTEDESNAADEPDAGTAPLAGATPAGTAGGTAGPS